MSPQTQASGLNPLRRYYICSCGNCSWNLPPFKRCSVCDESPDDGESGAAFIYAKDQLIDQLIAALQAIANIAGNLPDERLTSATGPMDAAARGIKLVGARDISRAALAKAGV